MIGQFADIRRHRLASLEGILAVLAAVLILRVTASVISGYVNYFPPDFASDFLHGRQGHFWGPYQSAFYAHILSGPLSLVVGLILIGGTHRSRFPTWHRHLGRIQLACVVLLVTPSGLWMAYYAAAGPVAAVGLASLAIATASCALLGARAAVARRFADHRRWMWRCYLLLCSAVVLRVFGGLATATGVAGPWVDPLATWLSWLLPLSIYEIVTRRGRGMISMFPGRVPASPAAYERRESIVR